MIRSIPFAPFWPEIRVSYPPEHKQQTRERIVASARRLWKAKGYANVSINEIMKDAGLTHGGFYAHFKSKDDLFAEAALDTAILERYRAMLNEPDVTALSVFETVIDTYLSTAHRDNPAEGCPLVALSDDAWRLGADVQGAYTKLADTAIKQLTHVLDGDGALARTVLAAMVGAIQVARGVDDADLSERILADTKATLMSMAKDRLGAG